MQISSLLVGLALFAAALVYVGRPFFEKPRKAAKTVDEAGQAQARESVLSALRDLDFDYKTGKISEEDYQPLRAQLLAEAAQVIEKENKEQEQLEALIQSRRKSQSQQVSCPSCGNKIVLGDTFCSSCGTKLEVRIEAAAQS
jgi:hypothetical protein